jgi:Zn-dependent protease
MENILETIGIAMIVLMSVVLHEVAHGLTAYKLGDSTAKNAGRLTLNPIKHIDPFGTVILPGILILLRAFGVPTVVFGWAKPVPVNFRQLGNPKRDMMIVAMAGPATNILIAWITSLILINNAHLSITILNLLHFTIFVNLLLAVFNMMPVPPLDGSRLVSGIIPNRWGYYYSQIEPFGILVVFGLLYIGLMDAIVFPIIEWIGHQWEVTF